MGLGRANDVLDGRLNTFTGDAEDQSGIGLFDTNAQLLSLPTTAMILPHPRTTGLDASSFSQSSNHFSLCPGSEYSWDLPSKLEFLTTFTTSYGIAKSFRCGSSRYRSRLILTAFSDWSPGDTADSTLRSPIPLRSPTCQETEVSSLLPERLDIPGPQSSAVCPSEVTNTSVEVQPRYTGRPGKDWIRDPSITKREEIVSGLKEVVCNRPRKSPISLTWSIPLEWICRDFFSPTNLRKFLVVYWSFWNPNWPVIHKPTFHESTTPATLLAGMAIMGAFLSPSPEDKRTATLLSDAVEEWIFSDDELCDNPIAQSNDDQEESQIQKRLHAMRAAYCVLLYQTWEGTEESRRRCRQIRFTQLISVARSLGWSRAAHGDLQKYLNRGSSYSNWKTFVLREELIRTFDYIFLLDSCFVIFNNTPPRIILREVQIELSCPESCFQAGDPESWLSNLNLCANTTTGRNRIRLSDLMSVLDNGYINEECWQLLTQMTTLNFFTVASGK